jgi:hypothetical protein
MALSIVQKAQLARTAGARGTRGLTLTQSSRTTVTVQMMGILTREKSLTYLQWPRVATVSPVQATAIATKGSSACLWVLTANTACVLVKITRIVCPATSAIRPQAFSRLAFQTLTTV